MALKDIEKLREKVEKDPNSRLFVPLAEEYRKEGMTDEAIEVLQKGLERQPGYTSARVSLGKIFLEKGMQKEARDEFEKVVRSVPDNLFAQKKLADLYRDMGEGEAAVRTYRAVLKLNAMDEDALANIRELESGSSDVPATEEDSLLEATAYEETPEVAVASPVFEAPDAGDAAEIEPAEAVEEIQVAETLGETLPDDAVYDLAAAAGDSPMGEGAAPAEDFDAFKSSLFGFEPSGDEPAEDIEAGDDVVELLDDEEAAHADDYSLGDINGPLKAEGAAASVFGRFDMKMEEDKAGPAAARISTGSEASTAEADRLVADGDYTGALRVYRLLLSEAPDDRGVLQRVEELRALLKMLGKDKEALVERLTAVLEGIRQRRDEFFGRT